VSVDYARFGALQVAVSWAVTIRWMGPRSIGHGPRAGSPHPRKPRIVQDNASFEGNQDGERTLCVKNLRISKGANSLVRLEGYGKG